MVDSKRIEATLKKVRNQSEFIQDLLIDTLQWPIDGGIDKIEDMSFVWTAAELNAKGLDKKIVDGTISQIQPLEQNQPWGIFVLEFTNEDVFTTGRGFTGPLRKVLRGLIPKRRRQANLTAWDRENLLFICTHNYEYFRFAYFKPAEKKGQAEPLAMFGWDSGDAALRTLCEYNLPFLVWSDNPQQPQWRDAFNVEKVTQGFYSQVARLFTDLVGGSRKQGSKTYQGKNLLTLPGSHNDTICKEFAVRLIGRLVFCWFLKKKRSKDGVPLLPQELLSTDSINNKGLGGYYHSILEPLFFEVLNTPQDARKKEFKKKPWSLIPFLNGGLFTPHEDDFYKLNLDGISEHLNDLIIPDDWIRELFGVFETYNFTIEESTPLDIEVAVDPEILGRIFENLLAEINPETGETARKATGSYYTPRPIVEYMVDESLKQYLITKTKLPEEKISPLLSYSYQDSTLTDSEKDNVIGALDTIKIIDPACGSGAFPMGILQKILLILQKIDPQSKKWLQKILARIDNITARKEIEKKLKEENWNYVHKLGIIQNSIYGVDIQPIAVEISKLRCFLSLIVDQNVEDAHVNRGIEPLPNLDFRFVCGNSLIDTIFGLNVQLGVLTNRQAVKKLIADIEQNKSMYFSLSTEQEKVQAQLQLLRQKLELAEYLIRDKVDELSHAKAYTNKFFTDDTLTKKEAKAKVENETIQKDLELLRKRVNEARAFLGKTTIQTYQDIDKIRDTYFSEFFAWRIDFAEVFANQSGFDIVIANPPYGIMNKKQNKAESIVVPEEELAFYKNSNYYEPASGGMINIFRLFILRSIHLLSENGIFSEIFPLAFTGDLSISRLRKYILDHNNILFVEAFPERDNPNKRVFEAVKMSVCILNLKKIKTNSPFFIRTNTDRFIDNSSEKNYLTQEIINKIDPKYYGLPLTSSKETNLLSRLLSKSERFDQIGECITGEVDMTFCKKSFTDNPQDAKLLKGAIIDRYQLRTKMSQGEIVFINEKKLFAIKKNLTRDFKTQERIVLQGITGVNESSRLKMMIIKDAYCANSLNYLRLKQDLDLKYLLGILNSKLLNFIFSKFSTNSNVNGYEVDNLPIPKEIPQETQEQVKKIVEEILTAKKTNRANTGQLENQIDQIVYKLYGLTDNEIAIIENSVK